VSEQPAGGSAAHTTGLALLAAASFALLGPVTVLITRDGTSLLVAMTWRMAIGGALLWLVARRELARDGGAWPAGVTRRRLVLIGGLGQLVVTYLSLASLAYIPAPTQVFLFYSYPVWITLLQVARGAESLDRRRLFALALAIVGILFVLDPQALRAGMAGGSQTGVGVALALIAAVCYAVYVPLLGWLQRDTRPTVASAYIVGSGALWFALTALVVDRQLFPQPTPLSIGGVIMLGVVCTLLAFWSFMRALAGLGSVRLAILSTAEPFIAGLYAMVLLGQRPGPLTALGGCCIVSAVVVLIRSPRAAPSVAAGPA
jgi:drug/metabolite transporter (DMT)-like permease